MGRASALTLSEDDLHHEQKNSHSSKKRKSDGVAVNSQKFKTSSSSKSDDSKKVVKVYKSAEFIDSSEDDDDLSGNLVPSSSTQYLSNSVVNSHKHTSSANAQVVSKTLSPSKMRKAILNSVDHSSEGDIRNLQVKSHNDDVTRVLSPQTKAADNIVLSESEMSIVHDEPPKKRSKQPKAVTDPTKQSSSTRRTSKAGGALSKDEETIKRLKAVVTACGVKKLWSKEFDGLNRSSQQIQKLKEILGSLGMQGRPSIAKAKAIREHREMARELEDVQAFEQSVKVQDARGRRMRSSEALSVDRMNDSVDDDELHDTNVAKKRKTARQSIMAFLQDQDESDS